MGSVFRDRRTRAHAGDDRADRGTRARAPGERVDRQRRDAHAAGARIDYAILPCSLGRLLVAATDRGICNVRLGDGDPELEKGLAEEFPFAVLERGSPRVETWCRALAGYVDGETTRIGLPFDVRASRFQRRVWDALRAIPRGATRSYSELAASLGMPRGARAVARACATNPIAIVVPCHRVVARGGGLAGYRWGVERKRALLEREGALRSGTPGSGSRRPRSLRSGAR